MGVVANEFEAFGLVLYDVGGNGRMVGHLLDKEGGTAAAIHIRPIGIEKSRIRLDGVWLE